MTTRPERFLTAGQVAYLFGSKTADWLYRHRKQLEGQGFPKPLLGGCYDPLAVYAWRLAQLAPAHRAALAATHPGDPTAPPDYEAELRANAERIAEGLGRPRLVGNS